MQVSWIDLTPLLLTDVDMTCLYSVYRVLSRSVTLGGVKSGRNTKSALKVKGQGEMLPKFKHFSKFRQFLIRSFAVFVRTHTYTDKHHEQTPTKTTPACSQILIIASLVSFIF